MLKFSFDIAKVRLECWVGKKVHTECTPKREKYTPKPKKYTPKHEKYTPKTKKYTP